MTNKTPEQRVSAILAEAVGRDLSSWEKHEFLPNIRKLKILSDKQERELAKIEDRVLGDH